MNKSIKKIVRNLFYTVSNKGGRINDKNLNSFILIVYNPVVNINAPKVQTIINIYNIKNDLFKRYRNVFNL